MRLAVWPRGVALVSGPAFPPPAQSVVSWAFGSGTLLAAPADALDAERKQSRMSSSEPASPEGSQHSPKSSSSSDRHITVTAKDLSEINGRSEAEQIRLLRLQAQRERETLAKAREVSSTS